MKDGGPVTPVLVINVEDSKTAMEIMKEVGDKNIGLSIRDYFAGQALSLLGGRSWDHIEGAESILSTWAEAAYTIADKMIEEREK